jgi:hypothetical protein
MSWAATSLTNVSLKADNCDTLSSPQNASDQRHTISGRLRDKQLSPNGIPTVRTPAMNNILASLLMASALALLFAYRLRWI